MNMYSYKYFVGEIILSVAIPYSLNGFVYIEQVKRKRKKIIIFLANVRSVSFQHSSNHPGGFLVMRGL